MNDGTQHSEILEDILLFIYPLIILFGIYIILTGTSQPGGGFQGGAVLVAVFMCRYLVYPDEMRGLDYIKKLDKIILIFILILVSVVIFAGFKDIFPFMNEIYNMLIGILIGIKVCFGLSIIFYTFSTIEGGEDD